MAKTNNKGFTLIEIVIAVAILSILLTPVVNQFAQTMETSRKAKALQEANETAVYEVEEFQTYTKKELDKKYGSPAEYTNLPAELWTKDSTLTGGSYTKKADITYSTYEYTLDDAEIGAKREVYTNKVVLDDLSNQVRAYGGESASEHYKIDYDLSEDEQNTLENDGFTITNEGSAVKYDANGRVNAVVCTTTVTNADGTVSPVSYVQNANEVNLGNMQNLDKNTVALVLGGTSSYDSDAFTALFAKAMDRLREEDYKSWQQALLNVDSESILSQDSMNNSKRLIKIYTNKVDDSAAANGYYYIVKIDVYYDYSYKLMIDGSASGDTFHDMITYTVFSQKFYTEDAPNIYFEYQPYCVSGSGSSTVYQSDDYILFDNHVDETKLYLYKPYKDQQNASASINDYYTVDTNGDGVADAKEEFYTYYTDSSKTTPVKIHFASKTTNNPVSVKDKNGEAQDPDDANTYKRIYIFTNLDINGYETGASTYSYTESGGTVKTKNAQFVSDDFGTLFRYVKGEDETKITTADEMSAVYQMYPLGNTYTINYQTSDGNGAVTPVTDTMKVLYTLGEDTREADRLYTITVQLDPNSTSLNTVRLSGAKGAN